MTDQVKQRIQDLFAMFELDDKQIKEVIKQLSKVYKCK